MNPTRNTLQFSWGEVSYLEWMPERATSKAPVLLLHGAGLDSASLSWRKLGAELSERGRRVIAPDHPGYGESPVSPWVNTQERLVEYVGELIDALGLDHYVLGGLSMGGGMTIGHLLTRPEGAVAAMLFGSYGFADYQFDGIVSRPMHAATWAAVRSGVATPVMRFYQRRRLLLKITLDTLIRNPEERTREMFDEVLEASKSPTGFSMFGRWQQDQFRWRGLRSNYQGRLHELELPTLIVHGEGDNGIPVAAARRAAARIPNSTLLVVRDAGHWVQRDRPKVVHPAVVEFLSPLP